MVRIPGPSPPATANPTTVPLGMNSASIEIQLMLTITNLKGKKGNRNPDTLAHTSCFSGCRWEFLVFNGLGLTTCQKSGWMASLGVFLRLFQQQVSIYETESREFNPNGVISCNNTSADRQKEEREPISMPSQRQKQTSRLFAHDNTLVLEATQTISIR